MRHFLAIILLISVGICPSAQAGFLESCLGFAMGLVGGGPRSHAPVQSETVWLRNPQEFQQQFSRSNARNQNVLEIAAFRQALEGMHRILPVNHPLRGEIDSSVQGRTLSYSSFMDLYLRVAEAISPPGVPRFMSREEAHRKLMERVDRGAVFFPVVADQLVSRQEMLQALANGVFHLQLPSRTVSADWVNYTPIETVEHDILHARNFLDARVGAEGRPPANIRAIIHEIPQIENARLRDDVAAVMFEWLHEAPNQSRRTFFGERRQEARGLVRAGTYRAPFLTSHGDTEAAQRQRLTAALDWIESHPLPP